MEMTVHLSGDAKGGWICDVHDGFKQGVYRPDAEGPETAVALAMQEHARIAGRGFDYPTPPTKAEQRAAEKEAANDEKPTKGR